MNKTTYDRGMEKGLEKERLRILRVAETLLRQKFGTITTETIDNLRQFSSERLEELLVHMDSAHTLADLGLPSE